MEISRSLKFGFMTMKRLVRTRDKFLDEISATKLFFTPEVTNSPPKFFSEEHPMDKIKFSYLHEFVFSYFFLP